MAVSLEAVGSELRCVDKSGTVYWTVSVDDLILVAEYTTNEGPFVDDYYLIFCSIGAERAVFATCTFYAEGRDATLRSLSDRLGSPLELVLCGSTAWASRVLWPSSMVGEPYFSFEIAEPRHVLNRLQRFVFGPTTERFLSDPVQRYIREKLKSHASSA